MKLISKFYAWSHINKPFTQSIVHSTFVLSSFLLTFSQIIDILTYICVVKVPYEIFTYPSIVAVLSASAEVAVVVVVVSVQTHVPRNDFSRKKINI